MRRKPTMEAVRGFSHLLTASHWSPRPPTCVLPHGALHELVGVVVGEGVPLLPAQRAPLLAVHEGHGARGVEGVAAGGPGKSGRVWSDGEGGQRLRTCLATLQSNNSCTERCGQSAGVPLRPRAPHLCWKGAHALETTGQ